MNYKNPGKIEFREKLNSSLSGDLYVNFPFNVAVKFGVTSSVPVRVVFDNKVEYHGDLINNGTRCHTLPVQREVYRQLGARPGSYVNIELELDRPTN